MKGLSWAVKSHQAAVLSEAEKALVRGELEWLLETPHFSSTKRCSAFLGHVVEATLTGRDSELKERIVGVTVFGRMPEYDTGEDAIVRVTANEVRKKLAQCYGEKISGRPLRIHLPAGSYRVEFQWAEEPDAGLPAVVEIPRARRRFGKWWLAGLLAAVSVVSFFLGWQSRSRVPAVSGDLQRFWSPATRSAAPVLICVGTPVRYALSDRLVNEYIQTLPMEARLTPFVVPIAPDRTIRGADILPLVGQDVGVGNAYAAADIYRLMARLGKPARLRIAADVSYAELRVSPAVLIGADTNIWTQPLTTQLRFYFQRESRLKEIIDRTQPGRKWALASTAADGKTNEDFALITRIWNSATGNPLFFLAGFTHYGTRAAGELVSNPDQMRELLEKVPPDWATQNMQLVIHTKIHNVTSTPATLVASHFWR